MRPQDERDQRFPKGQRLRKRREFLRLQRHGARIYGRRLIFHFRPTRSPCSRIGITVSRKVGNAVVRNQVKRWIREVWRTSATIHRRRDRGETPYDVVVTAKRGVDDFSYEVIRDELVHVISRYLKNPTAGSRSRGGRGSARRR